MPAFQPAPEGALAERADPALRRPGYPPPDALSHGRAPAGASATLAG